MIKAVVFDLDNTLVNFMEVKRRAVAAAADAMIDAGLPFSKNDTIERVFNMYDREGIEDQKVFDKMLVEEFGDVDARILAAGIIGYRKAKEGAMVLYPHVRDTIAQLLKRGLKLAIVSDAPGMSVWTRLVFLGLAAFFDVVVTHDDTGKRKPDPAPFQMALDRCCFLALALLGRFLVVLAAAKFGQDARLFTGTLKPTQGSVKILIFLNVDTRHTNYCLCFRSNKPGTRPGLSSA